MLNNGNIMGHISIMGHKCTHTHTFAYKLADRLHYKRGSKATQEHDQRNSGYVVLQEIRQDNQTSQPDHT